MKTAVVTGASSGMGMLFVKKIDNFEHPDKIWVIARREDKLKELQKEIKAELVILKYDLTDMTSFDKYKEVLEAEKPQITTLVCAAGFGTFGDYTELPIEKANSMIDLNVKALVDITYLTLPYMASGSKIIELGSESVFSPLPYLNVYASTKSFVRHFSRALHYEVKNKGISVTCVCPGWVKTEFFDHTNDHGVKHSPKKYSPMLLAEDVVDKAYRDACRGKQMSVIGTFTKLHHLTSKLLPQKLLIGAWKKMLK